jgi:hypothetical protein
MATTRPHLRVRLKEPVELNCWKRQQQQQQQKQQQQ